MKVHGKEIKVERIENPSSFQACSLRSARDKGPTQGLCFNAQLPEGNDLLYTPVINRLSYPSADFEDEGRRLRARKCGQPQKVEKAGKQILP